MKSGSNNKKIVVGSVVCICVCVLCVIVAFKYTPSKLNKEIIPVTVKSEVSISTIATATPVTAPLKVQVKAQKLLLSTSTDAVFLSAVTTVFTHSNMLAQDAVYNKADVLFMNATSSAPSLVFAAQDQNTGSSIISGRIEVEHRLQALTTILQASTTLQSVSHIRDEMSQDLGEIRLFLDYTSLEVNTLSATFTPDVWKTNLAQARTEITDALTDLSLLSTTTEAFSSTTVSSVHGTI